MITEFSGKVQGIYVKFAFHKGVNIVGGNSGSGKSFLFSIISKLNVLESDGDRFAIVDYRCSDFKQIKQIISSHDMIILDNFELYITKELLDYIFSVADKKIIIMNLRWVIVGDSTYYRKYITSYDGKELTLVEL